MAKLLTSKPVVGQLTADLSARVDALKSQGVDPVLAIVRVGDRPDDISYERSAVKKAALLGIETRVLQFNGHVTEAELLARIQEINADPFIHGCLLLRPLPALVDEKAVCDALSIEKDVDGISTAALGAVFTDAPEGFAPCTAVACEKMLDFYHIPVEGKHVVVVGRSLVIGKPVAMLLLKQNASVTICHSRTKDLQAIMRMADVVICATGRPRAYGADCFAPGQVVLDVGINFDDAGTLCGDVDFDAVEPVVDAITPVPGGIGALTTLTTMEHTIVAAERLADSAS